MRDQQEAPTDDFEIADPIAPNDDPDGAPGSSSGDEWEEENTDDPAESETSKGDPADPDNGEEPFSSAS